MGNQIKKVHLLIIDPQHDFCHPDGALFVPGATEDMNERLPAMIRRLGAKLDDIHVTLDCHHTVDVAHPIMWKDANGKHPDPFTIITAADVENGVWTPMLPSMTRRFIAYSKGLENSGRYPLCVWPPHCLIGSLGNSIMPDLFKALVEWETQNFGMVDYVSKGSNIYTEHYSAVKAEVPDPDDPSTQVNTRFIKNLMEADVLAIAGEAGSHCLANTVRDIATEFGDDSYVQKMILLTDATSPVPSFEKLQDDFVAEMTGRGMQTSTTVDFLT
jgi:nicotinamidase-related amidase